MSKPKNRIPDVPAETGAGKKVKTEPVQKQVKKKRPYPGILEEDIVYSCAGPRVDPDHS